MAIHSFRLPDIGEGVVEGEVVEWLVIVGESIVEDQPLLTVMTDKATVDIPSPVTGVVTRLTGDVGDILPVGKICAEFEVENEEISQSPSSSNLEDDHSSSSDELPSTGKSETIPSINPISTEFIC